MYRFVYIHYNIYKYVYTIYKNIYKYITCVYIVYVYYISHETVTFDDRDLPWINKNAKQLILEKNEMYKSYAKENKDSKIFDKVKCLQNKLNSIIESNKQKYHHRLSNKWLVQ